MLVIIVIWLLIRFLRTFIQFPVPGYVGFLLGSPMRLWLQKPSQLIARSGIESGMTVVDLGCGIGPFIPHVALAVGNAGQVYAIEIRRWMLRQLKRKLAKKKFRDITNIDFKLASAHELPFEDESIDLIYMVAVLEEIPDRSKTLREIRRVLRTGGILAVTEMLIDPEYPLRTSTIKHCRREGFEVDASLGRFWNYTVRFRKQASVLN